MNPIAKLILACVLTALLPVGALIAFGNWWQLAFSWDPNYSPPWSIQSLLILAGGLFLATFASLGWAIALLLDLFGRTRRNR